MLKWQSLTLILHTGALFVVPKEEHLMMLLFSSYGWYPTYRVVPETSGLPEISGNIRCFGLPATRWFPKLNRVGSGIKRNTGYRVGFGYPLGTAHAQLLFKNMPPGQVKVQRSPSFPAGRFQFVNCGKVVWIEIHIIMDDQYYAQFGSKRWPKTSSNLE